MSGAMPSSQQDPHTPLLLRSPRAELIHLTLTKGILCARAHTERGYRGLDMVYKKQNQSLWQNLFSTVPRLKNSATGACVCKKELGLMHTETPQAHYMASCIQAHTGQRTFPSLSVNSH